jgi:hypothetical protein
MGDRCYLAVTLHGRIETIEIFEQVVEAINREFWKERENVVAHLREAAMKNENPEFAEDEVNYASIDNLERILRKHKIDFQVSHGEGEQYSGGERAYYSDTGADWTSVSSHGDAVIYLSSLERALEGEDPLLEVQTLITQAQMAMGSRLPTFSLSHEVMGWLTIDGPNLVQQSTDA